MLASAYKMVSKSVRGVMTLVGLLHPAHRVPGLAEWRRVAVAR